MILRLFSMQLLQRTRSKTNSATNWIFALAIICILFVAYNRAGNAPFVLLTFLYNEKDERRRQEYITCLRKNCANSLVSEIHVLYDVTKNDDENYLFEYLKGTGANVLAEPTIGRPSFAYCFELANNYYPGRTVILSNADIYFNETLSELDQFNFNKTLICLTRWNVQKDGSLQPYYVNGKPNYYSQDTWIFRTPIVPFGKGIYLGLPGCDGNIAFEAQKKGLHVINPCLSIVCCHYHLSQLHNYTGQHYKNLRPVIWSSLQQKTPCSHPRLHIRKTAR